MHDVVTLRIVIGISPSFVTVNICRTFPLFIDMLPKSKFAGVMVKATVAADLFLSPFSAPIVSCEPIFPAKKRIAKTPTSAIRISIFFIPLDVGRGQTYIRTIQSYFYRTYAFQVLSSLIREVPDSVRAESVTSLLPKTAVLPFLGEILRQNG